MATKHKQKFQNGTQVKFLGYSDDDGKGTLVKDSTLNIVSFDANQGLYNVKDDNGTADSLFPEEFEEIKVEAVAKSRTKAPAAEAPAKAEAAPKAAKVEKPAKVETPAQEVIEAPLPTFKKTTSFSAAVKEHDNDPLKAAKAFAEEEAKTEFVLGGLLAFIKRNNLQATIMSSDVDAETQKSIPLYTADLAGYNAYVYEELGLHHRKAHSLGSIYEKFSQITTEAKIAKIGWTKLRELLPLENIGVDNVDAWLAKAKELTTNELHESVRVALVEIQTETGTQPHGSRQLGKQTTFKLVAFEDQGLMWREALDKAKQTIGKEKSDSEATNHIFTEWLGFYSEKGEGQA